MLTWFVRRCLSAATSFVFATFVLYYFIGLASQQIPSWPVLFTNAPITQYVLLEYRDWLLDFIANGGLERSLVTGRSAEAMLLERVAPTLLLMGSALLLQIVVGVPAGVVAAIRRPGRLDLLVNVLASGSMAAPTFLLALFAVVVFAVRLHLFPSGEMVTPGVAQPNPVDVLRHLILPATTLAFSGVGRIVRYTRVAMLEALSSDFMVTARAKGLPVGAAAFRHALPNAILPVITVIGLQVSTLLGGTFLLEIVFNWPGAGRVGYDALLTHDYPVLLQFGALVAVGAVLGTLVADVLYVVADPRLRLGVPRATGSSELAISPRVVRLAALVAVTVLITGSMPTASDQRFVASTQRDQATGATPPVGCIRLADGTPCATPAPPPTFVPVAIIRASTPPPPSMAQRLAGLAAVVRPFRFSSITPGCALAISDHGATVFAQGYGSADLATGRPITPNTVFDVASVAKQFVAGIVALLAEQGRLSLNDDVHRYVPELSPYPDTVTLRELVYHESGLPQFEDILRSAGHAPADRLTEQQELGAVARVAGLAFVPGSTFDYTHTNYFLLRVVAERVTGSSFDAIAAANLLQPLGMTSSRFAPGPGPATSSAEATAYHQAISVTSSTYVPRNLGWDMTGPGGLRTTVLDLLRWADNFRTGIVGGQPFLRQQLTSGSVDPDTDSLYAYGLRLSTVAGHALVWHDGGFRRLGLPGSARHCCRRAGRGGPDVQL